MPLPSAATGALLVTFAAVLWGTTGTLQALSAYPGSALGLGAARVAVAGLLLVMLAALRHGRRAVRPLLAPAARAAVLVGAACMAAYQGCFFVATRETGVAIGTLTAIGSAPILAGLLGAALGARPTRAWMAATAVALVGLVLLVAPAATGQLRPLGVAAGLGAGAAYAGYTWCSRRLLDAGVPPLPVLAALFAGAAVLLAPVASVPAAGWLLDPDGLRVVGVLAIGATVLPYLIWIRGVAATAPAVATTLTLTEPLTATLLGVLLLGEALSGPAALGAGLIAAGLLATVVASARISPRSA
ncbi:drug/metabolite transporter, DME family [Micromonospora pattaloongensis]|uniref:Drug/metabolite transporter, DME family n=1 Tax=Micromonospora pattaloongensis TaxID=405436 RepID=A0A1H3T0K5_9ACTN|nr:EamA family transporter [Micromonospora pattaloongensis]SDZ43714.1 drug/metabolite transporter, DME family [Micromonospora pattaloongensis]